MTTVNELIFQLSEDILDSVAQRMTDRDVTVPERQYVHQGEVALDCCDQLVVSLMGLVHTMPGGEETVAVCAPAHTALIDVWLTRCVPGLHDNGDSPTPEELTDSAETLQTDLWVFAYVLWLGYQQGDWGGGCVSVLFGPVVAYGPEGDCGGAHATIQINLTGLGAIGVPS